MNKKLKLNPDQLKVNKIGTSIQTVQKAEDIIDSDILHNYLSYSTPTAAHLSNDNKTKADRRSCPSPRSNRMAYCYGDPTWSAAAAQLIFGAKREYLGNQRIGNVFIPGTHNSGSYKGIIAVFEGYVLNQDRNIWTQLVFGIRYLDLRIGYTPEEELYIYHDHVRVAKVEPILRQIKKFAELAPREVIIVDIHRFPFPRNFTRQMHQKFTRMLDDILGVHVLSPHGYQREGGPSFNEIWAQNKSIIISYADSLVSNSNPWLWQPIKQFWGNTNKVSELKDYLWRSISEYKGFRNPLWALMAELTPGTWDVILRKNNLRVLAQNVNKEVTKWFRDEWFNEANIVTSDYFLGNDLIRVAIEGNKAKNVNYY
ncbi:uncharacterized protein LOC115876150 [Sitophilus oryzae]|uniref:Uncharacterized protein LOC115876150 n=1 Tax=Sitophilus oryzae TaxID=7048 RepID=A0A6J2XA30_SITOR|nr:uncharacterized protein LOC115876150 [Sitophilus oryzae]